MGVSESLSENLKGVGLLFYIISPNETAISKIEEAPDYYSQAMPYFCTFIILEYLIQWYKNKKRARLADGFTSVSTGIYFCCEQMLTRGMVNYIYVVIYNNLRVIDLPWDCPLTWYATAIGIDFGYYWVHRAAHEINIFWAKHQVHHSSEDYNLTTALRQPASQRWLAWPFYLPLAFFIPPSIYLIHLQFNLIYQFWLHTELVEDLGVLEYILNTPKHHRVHHGSNRYCLDKNYGGVLIIWDKLFGTFAEERKHQKIVYGLVSEVKSFNPFYLQIFHFVDIYHKFWEYFGWENKLSVLFKGPGWSPGTPRLGNPEDCPEIPEKNWKPEEVSFWKKIYVTFHWGWTGFAFLALTWNHVSFNQVTVLLCVISILSSLTSIGLILENREIGVVSEFWRCALILIWLSLSEWPGVILSQVVLRGIYLIFTMSVGMWASIWIFKKKNAGKVVKLGKSIKTVEQENHKNSGAKWRTMLKPTETLNSRSL